MRNCALPCIIDRHIHGREEFSAEDRQLSDILPYLRVKSCLSCLDYLESRYYIASNFFSSAANLLLVDWKLMC